MAKSKKRVTSPTLQLSITAEQHERAVQSNSGGCLIADAIKEQYPHLTGITVDMATIRVTDREKGLRYIYLTPANAQHVLLAFDQGWPNPTEQLVIRRAVQIHPLIRNKTGKVSAKGIQERRAERLRTLEDKEVRGEPLSKYEKSSLTKLRKSPPPPVERPSSRGPAEVEFTNGGPNHGAVIHGGQPIPQGPAHPNLLRGRNRHFGAKLADPGRAFQEAVEAAVADRENNPPLPLDS